jgi:hypothetical protein
MSSVAMVSQSGARRSAAAPVLRSCFAIASNIGKKTDQTHDGVRKPHLKSAPTKLSNHGKILSILRSKVIYLPVGLISLAYGPNGGCSSHVRAIKHLSPSRDFSQNVGAPDHRCLQDYELC